MEDWQNDIAALEKELTEIDEALNEEERLKAEKKIIYNIAKKYDEAGEWEKALEYLNQALEKLAHYEAETDEKAEIYYNLAGIEFDQQDFIAAIQYYENIIALGDNAHLGRAHSRIAISYMQMNDFDSAITSANSAIECFQSTEEYDRLGNMYHIQAIIALRTEKQKEALAYFEQAIDVLAENQKYEELNEVFYNLSIFIQNAMRHKNQLIFFNNHLEQAEEKELEGLTGFWHYQRALWYEADQQKNEAFDDFKKSLELFQKHNIEAKIANIYYHLGAIYDERRESKAALDHYTTALKKMLALNQTDNIGIVIYYLQSSLGDINEAAVQEKIIHLLDEAKEKGFVVDEIEEEVSTELEDAHIGMQLEDNLAEVVKIEHMSESSLEEQYQELKLQVQEKPEEYLATSAELAERYFNTAKKAWFSKTKKIKRFEGLREEILGQLEEINIDSLNEESKALINTLQINLNKNWIL